MSTIDLQKLRLRSGLRDELQRNAVHTIAQARRFRSIVENMAHMATTTSAVHRNARHEKGAVSLGLHVIRQRLIEARPARAAFELRVRGKKRQVATGTDKRALAFFLIERTAAGALSAVLAQHHVLVRSEPLTPFHVGELAKICRVG